MSKIDTGGPAFPVNHDYPPGVPMEDSCGRPFNRPESGEGMTLRDYFAAWSLTEHEYVVLANAYFHTYPTREAASPEELRYFHADRMLLVRKSIPEMLAEHKKKAPE